MISFPFWFGLGLGAVASFIVAALSFDRERRALLDEATSRCEQLLHEAGQQIDEAARRIVASDRYAKGLRGDVDRLVADKRKLECRLYETAADLAVAQAALRDIEVADGTCPDAVTCNRTRHLADEVLKHRGVITVPDGGRDAPRATILHGDDGEDG